MGMMINRRRVMGNQDVLPEGVVPIEYLESSGTQWIDTHIPLSIDDVIYIEYERIANGFVYGSRVDLYTNYSGVTNESNSLYNIRMGNKVVYTSNIQPKNKVFCKIENGKIIINNAIVSNSDYGTSFSSLSCYLFTINANNSAYMGEYAKNRIYSFKIDGKIDLIPVVKDGVGYMYDRVSKQLFGNAGTGNFILGQDV